MPEGIMESQKLSENVINLDAARKLREAAKTPAVLDVKPASIGPEIPANPGNKTETIGATDKVVDLGEARRKRDEEWLYGLYRARFKENTERAFEYSGWKLNDEEWKRVERTDPNIYSNMQVGNRIVELQQQANGDKKLFSKLWQEELVAIRKRERQKQLDVEINSRRLPVDTLSRDELTSRFQEAGLNPLKDDEWKKREEMKAIDPKTLTAEQWQAWKRGAASLTIEELESIKEHSMLRQEYMDGERNRRVALGWSGDLGDLADGHYVDVILERADKLGVDHRSLTPQQRQELRKYNRLLTPEEQSTPPAQDTSREKILEFRQEQQRFLENMRWARLPEQDLLAFQEWFWSLPLDVVIDLWARRPEMMQPELQLTALETGLLKLFSMMRRATKYILTKLNSKTEQQA